MSQDIQSGPGDLVPGDQLAGYEIQEQIGRGGMAVVYRALDLRLGRLVALKVLAPHLGEDEAFRQRFIRESRALAGVDHPHIIPVFEAGEAAGVLFIAMRYVGHGDVRSLIESAGSVSPARTARIASQVASALDAAHAHGLVHRDVKPANMLLGQAVGSDVDHVYLSDFGLSKHSLTPSTLTSTGQFLGTLDYVSPEQIQGQPVDGRADQYALACTVVEMLTGAPPFRRDDSMALMWAQLEAAPPRLTERRPELPAAVDDVVAAAMSKSPAGRFATCSEFAAALAAACQQRAPHRPGPATALAEAVPSAHQAERYAARGLREGPSPHQAAPSPWSDGPGDWFRSSGGGQRAAAEQTGGPGWRANGASPGGPVPALSAPVRKPSADAGWPAVTPPTQRDGVTPDTRPHPPGRGQAGRGQAGAGRTHPQRARNVVLALLITIIGLCGIAAIAYKLAHRQDRTLPPVTVYKTVPATGGQGPALTVREYFAAINHRKYQVAWRLSGARESFVTFRAGFAGTAHDTVTILSVSGNVATVRLAATQTNGTVKTYQGTYTVTNGVISDTNVHRVS